MRCLEPSEIQRYISGLMDRKVAEAVEAHLGGCPRCRRAVSDAQENAAGAASPGPNDSPTVVGPEPSPPGADEESAVRVQCGGCGARYGIPKDRVRGRVLKVRCKSCGTILEVRGDAAASRSLLERGRKQWFLVIRRERVGPLSEAEVRERYQRGELRPRTYVWRQGFARWERLLNIPELQDLAGNGSVSLLPTRSVPPPPGQAVPQDDGPESRAEPGLPADQPALDAVDGEATVDLQAGAAGEVRESASRRPIGVLDAGRVAVPLPANQASALERSTPEPDTNEAVNLSSEAQESGDVDAEGDPERRMSGQRNEDSVLFSLHHLRQGIPAPEAEPPPTPAPRSGEVRPIAPVAPRIHPTPPVAERKPPGIGLVVGVGLAGAVLGAAGLLFALSLLRPEQTRALFGRPPAAVRDQGYRSGPLEQAAVARPSAGAGPLGSPSPAAPDRGAAAPAADGGADAPAARRPSGDPPAAAGPGAERRASRYDVAPATRAALKRGAKTRARMKRAGSKRRAPAEDDQEAIEVVDPGVPDDQAGAPGLEPSGGEP